MSSNEERVEEIHKPVITGFKRRKVYAGFKGDIWGADLTEMESLFQRIKMLNICYVSWMLFLNMHALNL